MLLEAKTRLGPYEVVEFLGAGGMGEVYKARDTRLNRNVAIKIVAERFTQRFSTEAHVIAALNHPHICTLYDVGPNYLVMEYIEGETLSARIRRGPISLDQTLEFAIQIAGALEAAHRHGIIHRDLKPGNIMLTDSGAKLLDFGLARFQDVRGAEGGNVSMTITDSAEIVGTLPYMSPEQLEAEDADARSDIFSFGAILYEMVTGQRAFQKESPGGTISAISRDQPKPLANFTQKVPHDLERIILRCLRKPREERYASAADVVHDLEECRALASEPASGINFKVLLRQSKRPRVAIPVLLAITLLAVLFGWWMKRSFKARWARAEALPEISQLIGTKSWVKRLHSRLKRRSIFPATRCWTSSGRKSRGWRPSTPLRQARRSSEGILPTKIVHGSWWVVPRSRNIGCRWLITSGGSNWPVLPR
jgi:eukaryotic-like serine/threonine-protein kinase